jgi:hypothetical protein
MLFLFGMTAFTTSLRIILNGKKFNIYRQYVAHEFWCLLTLGIYWLWSGTRHFLFWVNVCWYLSDIMWVVEYRKWIEHQTKSKNYWVFRLLITVIILVLLIRNRLHLSLAFVFINFIMAFFIIPIAFVVGG